MAEKYQGYFRQQMYPWDEWANGEEWIVRPEEHTDSSPTSFRSYLHAAAKKRKMKVQTKLFKDGSVAFQFYKKGDDADV